ncbi:uncharacterized protein [Rutidosis leptorrhynchoides]|uniref:uncharacterized protein n=1 Tax=Rutidosis leptorrhynchoides TaxID=125765 RepID=UPI003A994698
MEKSQYSFWSGLFKIHCRAYEVLDHIIPPTTEDSSSTNTTNPPPSRTASRERLDAIVLQWIYGTIYLDLLRTVYKDDSTAQQAWERLKGIFHENKNSRAVHLQHQFVNTRLENFPDASSYCQELKIIVDQLGNVGLTIEEDRLTTPHGPFPATPWTRPPTAQPGILGPRLTANYASSVVSQPTDLEAAMHTMTLNPLDDNWYLDTGATSYMTNNQGISEGDPNSSV